MKSLSILILLAGSLFLMGANARADVVHLDDTIIDGNACVGTSCVDGEVFGDENLKLDDTVVRILANDSSSFLGTFPRNDWQITFNDSFSGGQNYFAIDDISNATTPFKIEAGAPNHSLYVDDSGRLGLGTSTPFTDLHIVNSDTARIRIEDNGSTPEFWDLGVDNFSFFISEGFTTTIPFTIAKNAPNASLHVGSNGNIGLGTSVPAVDLHIVSDITPALRFETVGSFPQVWTVGGNSSSFFIRNEPGFGSNFPFIIKGGAAHNSIFVATGGEVGLGTNTPEAKLHVLASSGGPTPRMVFENPDAIGGNQKWFFDIKDGNGDFRISRLGSGVQEMNLTPNGNLKIPGNFVSGATTLNVPDYVFEPDYDLLPLEKLASFIEKEKHLPDIPSAKEINDGGINMTAFQMKLLQKVEELTLYVVQQDASNQKLKDYVLQQEQNSQELRDHVALQEQTIRELKERLEDMDS